MTTIAGLCECGCGGVAPIAKKTQRSQGAIAGQRQRYINHHKQHSEEAKHKISIAKKIMPETQDAIPFKIDGTYCRLIPLTRGYFAIVQADQYAHLMQWKWHAQKAKRTVYAARYERTPDGKRVHIDMHRQLKGFPDCNVDHRNGDGLHNFNSNLRVANDQENTWNRRPNSGRRFKGAYWDKNKGLYVSKICIGYRLHHLGEFGLDRDAAARAYDAAAITAFGSFARLNFPEEHRQQ